MNCLRCHAKIETTEVQVCPDCGWMPEVGQKNIDKESQRSSLLAFLAITLTASLLFVHTSTWDQYAFEVIPSKVKQSLGIASELELLSVANMCKERMLINCQETALEQALEKNQNNIVAIKELALLKKLQDKNAEALVLYARFVQLEGTDTKALYDYANLLTAAQNYELAEKYYVTALKSKPDVLQISVNEAYVNMLSKAGQLQKALKHIETLRKTGAPEYFLDREYVQIEIRMKSKG